MLVQVHGHGLQPRAVLRRLGNFHRKRRLVDSSTHWARLDLCLMLRYFNSDFRQVKHPAGQTPGASPPGSPPPRPGMRDSVHNVPHGVPPAAVGAPPPSACVLCGPAPARLLPTPLPWTPRDRLLQAITVGRFAAVAAVLGQLLFQRLHPLRKSANRLFDQRDHGLFQIGLMNFFTTRHHQFAHGAIVTHLGLLGKAMKPTG